MDTYSLPEGKVHMAPMGEAPTYVNTQDFPLQAGPAAGSSTESSPRKDLFDMSGFPFTLSFLFFWGCFLHCFLLEICAITEFSISWVLINNDD